LDGGAAMLIAADVASQDTFALALVARGVGFKPQKHSTIQLVWEK
jgi:hypothetical protein